MYLTLDIGNSNIVGGVFHEKKDAFEVIHSFRIITPSSTTTDELALTIKNMLEYQDIRIKDIRAAIFSSVVPSLNHNITKLMQLYFNITIKNVTHEYFDDLTIHYKEKEDLGLDRLVNIRAAQKLFGSPVIIIDFGTAITLDLLKANSEYVGGLILPGVAISLDSLIQQTSQLPKIELEYPQKLLGNSTKESIQNGLFFLYKNGLENIIKEIIHHHFPGVKPSAKEYPTVIVTGGLAPFITHKFAHSPQSVPFLTLIGLKILLDKQASR